MTVGVDVDEVCADLFCEWLVRYNRAWGDTLTPGDILGWDIAAYVKPACGRAVFDILHQPDLYDAVKPIPGAVAGVNALRGAGHRVVFVTSASLHQSGPKLAWLGRHGLLELVHGTTSPDYVVTQDKGLVRLDALIDDAPHNLDAFRKNHPRGWAILFDAPHNRAEARYPRAAHWDQACRLLGVVPAREETP